MHRETKHILALAGIFACRMLGLFMLIPVFTVYATHLAGATPFWLGVTLGIYGLTQSLFQIPLGTLSDRLGRKPIIAFGLTLFVIGSFLGALTHDVHWMMLARALQGTGAIGSALIALTTDLVREEKRASGMAIFGVLVGGSFALAMMLGPFVAESWGLSGIFYGSAGLGILGIIILYTLPTPTPYSGVKPPVCHLIWENIRNKTLIRLDFGIFVQHAIFTATFYAVPIILAAHGVKNPGVFYLSILLGSFLLAYYLIKRAEKKGRLTEMSCIAIALLVVAQLGLCWGNALWFVLVSLFVFFLGFNILEASLPALVSKAAPAHAKGTALGLYSSAQFLGIFVGGMGAGVLSQHFHLSSVFMGGFAMAVLWLVWEWPYSFYRKSEKLKGSFLQKTDDI